MSPKNTTMTDLSPDNKIINGLWISPDGRPLSNLERLCIYSFCAHGHDFRLWTYGDLPNVPQDAAPGKVEVCDGNEILPADKIFTSHNSLAHFADWFRWELLRQVGGWYADMDVVCLRPFDIADSVVFGKQNPKVLDSGILKLPKGCGLSAKLADACEHPNRIMPWDTPRRRRRKILRSLQFWRNEQKLIKWGEPGGPEGLILASRHEGMEYPHQRTWWFEPIPAGHEEELFNEDLHRREMLEPMLKHSYAVHFFNSVWKKNGWDKNGDFPRHSPFETLKRRYLPELQE